MGGYWGLFAGEKWLGAIGFRVGVWGLNTRFLIAANNLMAEGIGAGIAGGLRRDQKGVYFGIAWGIWLCGEISGCNTGCQAATQNSEDLTTRHHGGCKLP